MTRKVFWENPYLTVHDTTLDSVQGPEVTVRSTILYAFSGGQESDAGTIQGRPVLRARKEGPQIFYTLAPDHGLEPGQAVRLEFDWTRRYRLMRLHFAAELVLELVGRALEGVRKIGAHIAEPAANSDRAESVDEIWFPRQDVERVVVPKGSNLSHGIGHVAEVWQDGTTWSWSCLCGEGGEGSRAECRGAAAAHRVAS